MCDCKLTEGVDSGICSECVGDIIVDVIEHWTDENLGEFVEDHISGVIDLDVMVELVESSKSVLESQIDEAIESISNNEDTISGMQSEIEALQYALDELSGRRVGQGLLHRAFHWLL